MKVTLENFRCYHHKIFDIPDRGLILLSGKNGKGKTTFIQSIIYAFFGKCSVKPYSHGSKNCVVTLEYKDIKITRSHKPQPHKLTVEYSSTYTDDTAQKVIDKYIGLNYDEFMVSSYVAQRSKNSVISLTPAEQLRFIEKLAFTDEVRDEYQKKFKNKVKECQSQISYVEGKIASLIDHYKKEKNRLPEKIHNDLENIPPIGELRANLEKIKKKSIESDKTFKKVQEDLHNLKKEEERKAVILGQKKYLEIELEHLQTKKQNIGEILSMEDIDRKNKEIGDLIENMENIKKYSLYMQCLERANISRDEKIKEIESRLGELKENLEKCPSIEKLTLENEELLETKKLYEEERMKIEKEIFFREQSSEIFKSTISDIKSTFSTFKTDKTHVIVNSLNKKYGSMVKTIPKLEEEIQKLTEKNAHRKICGDIYDCPNCNTKLYFKDNALNIAEKEMSSSSEDLDAVIQSKKIELNQQKDLKIKMEGWLGTLKKFSDLNSKKPIEYTVVYNHDRFLEIRDEITKIKGWQEEVIRNESELKNLQSEDWKMYPPSIKSLFADVEERKKFFPKKFIPTANIKDVEKKIEDLKSYISEEKRKRTEFLNVEKDISLRESKLKSINSSLSKNFLSEKNKVEDLENEYNRLKDLLIKLNEESSSLNSTISIALDVENYKKNVQRIEQYSKDIEEAQAELKLLQRQYEGALGLLASDKEAQILSLKTTISKINLYSKFYLDRIFDEDDEEITVQLQSHKLSTSGEKKAKINTRIVYKGRVYESYDDFCGGESQKCELAFLFGVNDMLGSKIVLLDECINNLDSNSNMKTLYALKKISENKLVIAISHEAVTGVFDSIVYF